jgi:hypothetical protein
MNKHNLITGDLMQTKPSKTYANNFDAIFRKPEEKKEVVIVEELEPEAGDSMQP